MHTFTNPYLEDDYDLLNRKPLDIKPIVEVQPWVKTFKDVTGNDRHARDYFNLTGYEHNGKIPFEMITD